MFSNIVCWCLGWMFHLCIGKRFILMSPLCLRQFLISPRVIAFWPPTLESWSGLSKKMVNFQLRYNIHWLFFKSMPWTVFTLYCCIFMSYNNDWKLGVLQIVLRTDGQPRGIAFDGNSRLLVCDYANQSICMIIIVYKR